MCNYLKKKVVQVYANIYLLTFGKHVQNSLKTSGRCNSIVNTVKAIVYGKETPKEKPGLPERCVYYPKKLIYRNATSIHRKKSVNCLMDDVIHYQGDSMASSNENLNREVSGEKPSLRMPKSKLN